MALSYYAVADGFDVAEGSLVRIEPPPATPDQWKYAELEYYANQDAQFNGYLNAELIWSSISTSERTTVLTAFGLSDDTASNQITINARKNDDTWARMNCTAVYTQSDVRKPYGKDGLVIQLIGLEAAS